MKIQVTKEDIEQGEPGSSCNCPVARALKRAGFSEPAVSEGSIEWGASEARTGVVPPRFVDRFIELFDESADGDYGETRFLLAPFEFELPVTLAQQPPERA